MTPFGGVVTFKVEDETYMTPFGGVMNGAIITKLAGITGTATSSITETDIVNGGKTIVITLTADTWV